MKEMFGKGKEPQEEPPVDTTAADESQASEPVVTSSASTAAPSATPAPDAPVSVTSDRGATPDVAQPKKDVPKYRARGMD